MFKGLHPGYRYCLLCVYQVGYVFGIHQDGFYLHFVERLNKEGDLPGTIVPSDCFFVFPGIFQTMCGNSIVGFVIQNRCACI